MVGTRQRGTGVLREQMGSTEAEGTTTRLHQSVMVDQQLVELTDDLTLLASNGEAAGPVGVVGVLDDSFSLSGSWDFGGTKDDPSARSRSWLGGTKDDPSALVNSGSERDREASENGERDRDRDTSARRAP